MLAVGRCWGPPWLEEWMITGLCIAAGRVLRAEDASSEESFTISKESSGARFSFSLASLGDCDSKTPLRYERNGGITEVFLGSSASFRALFRKIGEAESPEECALVLIPSTTELLGLSSEHVENGHVGLLSMAETNGVVTTDLLLLSTTHEGSA